MDNHILLTIEFSDNTANANEIKGGIDSAIRCFSDAAKRVHQDVERSNNELPARIKDAIKAWKAWAPEKSQMLKSLDILIRRAADKAWLR